MPGAPSPRPRRRGPLGWFGGWFVPVAVLVLVAAGLAVFLLGGDDEPSEWDDRLVDLVAFVEEERGHDFDEVVTVNFLDSDEYTEASTGLDDFEDEGEPTVDGEAELRALGFVSGEFDLDEMGDALADTGTLAFYSTDTEEVYVRGTDLTPALRVTLVHELVHALQDQKFDLSRISDLDSHEAESLRSIAEGDATRIEELYVEELDSDEMSEYQETRNQEVDESSEVLDEMVPPRVQAAFQAPYLFGPALVMLADARDGNDAVDHLFTDVPSVQAAWDPATHDPDDSLAADQEILEVPLPDGAEEIDDGSFGPISWYLMLVGHVEPEDALDAVDSITADGYRSHRDGDRVCVDLRAESDEADLVESALDRWISEAPDHDAEVDRDGDEITFRTCDPGTEVDDDAAEDMTMEAILLPGVRAVTFAEMIEMGAPQDTAACFAAEIVEELSLDELASEEVPTDFDRRSVEVLESCEN